MAVVVSWVSNRTVTSRFAVYSYLVVLSSDHSFLEDLLSKVSSPPPPDGPTARGGPWPPLQCAPRPLDSLLCRSIHLNPSSSGPWTRHPATSFLVFLFVLLHTAFRTTSFLELRCLAFFLCDQATVFFGI